MNAAQSTSPKTSPKSAHFVLPPATATAGATPNRQRRHQPPPPLESPLLSDAAFRWGNNVATWLRRDSLPTTTISSATGNAAAAAAGPDAKLSTTRVKRARTKTPRATGAAAAAWDKFVSLWYVKPDPNAPPTPHLHGDADLPFSPLVPAFSSLPTSSTTLNRRGRIAQLILGVLFLLGLYELVQSRTGSTSSRSRPARVDSKSLKLQGRDPHRVLAHLVPPAPTSLNSIPRYQTHLPGLDSLWKEPDRSSSSSSSGHGGGDAAQFAYSDPTAESYEELSEIGDTTAIVLHWKRTDNVKLILAHLCQYTFFDTVLVWNNNPEVQLSHQTFAASRCPASKLRIYNSPRNLLFVARFLACSQADTPYCYFQDDDWLVRPLRSMYTQFSRDPEGPVVVNTNSEVAALFGLEWCFYNNPLHTCFAWVGTGAFTSRLHVDRFLSLSTLLGYSRDELAHADNSFTTFQNEPPYVLTSDLVPLPTPFGHSDGEGIQRNKDFIQRGLVRLSGYLDAKFPIDQLSEEEKRAGALTPLQIVSPSPYRPSLSPPLPPHPWSHHARSLCSPSDTCLFLTNVQLLPPPDASQYPGPDRVKKLQEWEEMLGWVGRGWMEGTERWREEEGWSLKWGYEKAVDGDPETAFRSPDVIRAGDYLGLLILAPLEPSVTRTVTLHVILEDARRVLNPSSSSSGPGRVRVEVSADGYKWVPARSSIASAAEPVFTCSGPRYRSTLPSPSLSNSNLVSPAARRILAAERAADESRTALGRWFNRLRRRRTSRPMECTVEVMATMTMTAGGEAGWKAVRMVATGGAGGAGGGGKGKAKKDEPVFDVGWGLYEMWITADDVE